MFGSQELKGKPGRIIAGDLESDDDRRPRDDGKIKQLEAEVSDHCLECLVRTVFSHPVL
jgi:hypothetical protein